MDLRVHVGGIYLCKDGRIRKVCKMIPAKRWSWQERFIVEVYNGKSTSTAKPRNKIAVQTMQMYAISEIPPEYHDKLGIYPAIYALKQTLVEIDCKMTVGEDPSDILVYRALAHARESGFKAGIRDGFEYPHAVIELPTGTIEFIMEPYQMFKLPTIIENQQRINKFLEGVEA